MNVFVVLIGGPLNHAASGILDGNRIFAIYFNTNATEPELALDFDYAAENSVLGTVWEG
jgi:hypothetical protein